MKKRKFLLGLVALAFLVVLSACNKTEDNGLMEVLVEQESMSDISDEESQSDPNTGGLGEPVSIYYGATPYCEGEGFCNIDLGYRFEPGFNGFDVAILAINGGGELEAYFPDPNGPQLAGQALQMTTDLPLSNEVVTALGVDAYTILAGAYPIIPVGTGVMITFTH